ncbi:tRNA (adenosine(37)-N6)-dimethylallyltransferase MiaA [Sphingoaurantiacus capsulatus]|uniref:tRNA dimethylallyltransferase n=1 Tax=Sphingoaurantiacus capsulatus TaxID=1771310 RepID=A0ABV7XEN4_9SPHN
MKKPPLAVIAGPTASGKSAMALDLAERRNGVVINADASQVYADLRIVSARPSMAEEARAPHRLYGIVDGAVACSAAAWAAMAREAIAEVQAEGRLPILVGGTGLYIRTLLDGIAPVPEILDDVRDAVRALDNPHAALATEDPAMAARLRPSDRQRSARALEVWRATGRSLGDWQQGNVGGIGETIELEPYVVEIDRDDLYARCDARFDIMLAEGALDEVAALAARHLPPALPVMKALGVPPLLRHLAGEIDLATAAANAKQDTRRYAKRQLTWFRNQAPGWRRLGNGGSLS